MDTNRIYSKTYILMDITVNRKYFTDKSTISEVEVNGLLECYFLEDKDRGLNSDMSLEEITKTKVKAETAIPYGRYKVVVTKSNRFSKSAGVDVYLPLLLNVKGYEGIRIHAGNRPEHSEGCLLPGTEKGVDIVLNSKTAFIKLNDKINQAIKSGDEVWITIKKSNL